MRCTAWGVTLREGADGALYYNHNPIKEIPDSLTRSAPANKAGAGDNKSETLSQTLAPQGDDVNMRVLDQGNRGSYNPQTGELGLLKDADLSTVLRELGHHFLESMNTLAEHSNAPQGIKDDFDTLLQHFNVKGETPEERMADWSGRTLEDRRAGHEQFAEGFEKYLFNGKAPVPELQSMFSRFRIWLMNVYGSMKDRVWQILIKTAVQHAEDWVRNRNRIKIRLPPFYCLFRIGSDSRNQIQQSPKLIEFNAIQMPSFY